MIDFLVVINGLNITADYDFVLFLKLLTVLWTIKVFTNTELKSISVLGRRKKLRRHGLVPSGDGAFCVKSSGGCGVASHGCRSPRVENFSEVLFHGIHLQRVQQVLQTRQGHETAHSDAHRGETFRLSHLQFPCGGQRERQTSHGASAFKRFSRPLGGHLSAVLSIRLTRLKPRDPPKERTHVKAGRWGMSRDLKKLKA